MSLVEQSLHACISVQEDVCSATIAFCNRLFAGTQRQPAVLSVCCKLDGSPESDVAAMPCIQHSYKCCSCNQNLACLQGPRPQQVRRFQAKRCCMWEPAHAACLSSDCVTAFQLWSASPSPSIVKPAILAQHAFNCSNQDKWHAGFVPVKTSTEVTEEAESCQGALLSSLQLSVSSLHHHIVYLASGYGCSITTIENTNRCIALHILNCR